ncbi:hypothetical protein EUGRSUZ_B03851 [Eucalyptus grandis]|uniref:Uncharacterized protein n=2 Tax=Eucalyptus grandis TaxID=71139 RepID=A0ACC3LYG4_EUCGR|nr:hypothetical protein EUGRSUZ_B03851 [Eucalyptus grandis]
MKNVDFSSAAREDSKMAAASLVGDENGPRRPVPACARPPASKTAASCEESPPPSPRPLERPQTLWLLEHYANIGEAKAGSAQAQAQPQPQPQPQQDSTCSGREKLKRHRDEVAGRVPIPDSWGQESFLKDWMDYSAFDTLLAPRGIAPAREALMAEGRRRRGPAPQHQRLRIEGRC